MTSITTVFNNLNYPDQINPGTPIQSALKISQPKMYVQYRHKRCCALVLEYVLEDCRENARFIVQRDCFLSDKGIQISKNKETLNAMICRWIKLAEQSERADAKFKKRSEVNHYLKLHSKERIQSEKKANSPNEENKRHSSQFNLRSSTGNNQNDVDFKDGDSIERSAESPTVISHQRPELKKSLSTNSLYDGIELEESNLSENHKKGRSSGTYYESINLASEKIAEELSDSKT